MPLAPSVLAKPFLKWAGGKRRLLEAYAPFFPDDFENYHEPFVGGGALFFHLAPRLAATGRKAILSDINPGLINAYRCVRDCVESLILRLAEHRQQHSSEHYYETRAEVPATSVEQAARFIYLNRTCFNGLYRENSSGAFNVPIGRYKKPLICDVEGLRAASSALQIAALMEQPFEMATAWAKGGDFLYFDPPYHPVSLTSNFTGYSAGKFTALDQARLRVVVDQAEQRGCKILLSNSSCSFTRQLYADMLVEDIQAARSINSKAERRGLVKEILVRSRQAA